MIVDEEFNLPYARLALGPPRDFCARVRDHRILGGRRWELLRQYVRRQKPRGKSVPGLERADRRMQLVLFGLKEERAPHDDFFQVLGLSCHCDLMRGRGRQAGGGARMGRG